MILATANTGHFEFQTLAHDEEHANRQLLAAFKRHAEEYRGADPTFMAEMIREGDVNYSPIALGETLRDGEVI